MMKRSKILSPKPAASALLVALIANAACVAVPDDAGRAPLATYVEDWRDEVIYQVMVDRFANGDINNDDRVWPGTLSRYQGGDWKGLAERLPYLEALGITTLWISPIVRNVETDADVDAYHGYWSQDLTELNPHFGDLASLRAFTSRAHARGMKVVLDIVVNHMGQVFFYDMNFNGKPDIYVAGTGAASPVMRTTEFDPDFDPRGVQAFTPLGLAGRAPVVFLHDPAIHRLPPKPGILGTAAGYHGLGRILNYDDPIQSMMGDFSGGLKDVATESPEVRATMIDVFAHWVELVNFDGLRIDTIKHVEHDFWRQFSAGIRSRLAPQGKSRFILFGEALDGNDELLGSYTQPGELDSVFYFSQHFQVFRDVFQFAHDPAQQRPTQQIADLWKQKPAHYGAMPQADGIGTPPWKALVNFIDNHDRPRFLFDAAGDIAALRNALTFLMAEDGIPCLYYGTELDFTGGNDPANRQVMWPTGFPTDGATFRHFARLARLRRAYAALRRGDTTVRYATDATGDEMDAGLFAFERSGGDAGNRYAFVVFNTNARHPSTFGGSMAKMLVSVPDGTELVDVLDPMQPAVTVGPAGSLNLTLAAQTAKILVPADQVIAEAGL